MRDERVFHFWDAKRFAGLWFAREVQGEPGNTWDMYFLYGPEATWEKVSGLLLSTGRTFSIRVQSCATSWRLLSRNSSIY